MKPKVIVQFVCSGLSGACLIAAAILLLAGVAAQAESQAPEQGSALPQDLRKESLGFKGRITPEWGGVRKRLEQAGIAIGANLVLEGFNNFRGGEKTSSVAASTFDLNLALDTRKLFNWEGGKFYVDLEDHAGRDPTHDLVGDFQVFDKLNSSPYLQVFELWFEQKLFDGKLRFKIGKVDANTEFSVIENGLDFINSSSQVSPTNFLLPTTPAPMPSANAFFTPNESFSAGLGAYYANRSVGFGNFVGSPQDAQLSENGTFLIGEAGLRWRQAPVLKRDGNLKLGAWDHTGTFTRFDGSRQQGVNGFYAILDQTLWQPAGMSKGKQGLRSFLEYGRTQRSVNPIDWHAGIGFAWTGMLGARPDDVIGFSPQYAHLSKDAGLTQSYELATEMFYRFLITSWATLMPDLQYIIHPGGQYPDALVGTLRLRVNF